MVGRLDAWVKDDPRHNTTKGLVNIIYGVGPPLKQMEGSIYIWQRKASFGINEFDQHSLSYLQAAGVKIRRNFGVKCAAHAL